MSASNWTEENWDDCPDQNHRYCLDKVGLQLGLGLGLTGVTLVEDYSMACSVGQTWDGNVSMVKYKEIQQKDCDIQETVDGIPIRKVYITNISIGVHRHDIIHIFRNFGVIRQVYLGVSKNDKTKQFAFVTFENPKDAARVLVQHKFSDVNGRFIYVSAADSWHQPKEGPDGNIVWKVNKWAKAKQAEESEEDDDQVTAAVGGPVNTVEVKEGLNVLNDDCLLHIFSFLSYKEIIGVERVCKRWQALSFRLWKCLHELNYSEPPFNQMLRNTPILEQFLRRCGQSISILNLAVKHVFNKSTLAIIAKYCSNLEVLRVANLFVGNRSLAHLGRCCPKLKQLVIDGGEQFSDNDLMSLLPKCHELSHLNLSRFSGIDGKCLVNIEGPVTELMLCGCPSIQPTHLIAGIQKISATLQSLTLSACGNLTSSELDKIMSAVPNLTSLTLSHWFDVKSLSQIGQLSKLTALDLNRNNAVSDTVLAAIAEGCTNLTSINLSGSGGTKLSDRGLSMLTWLHKLTDLDISYLEAATSVALKNLSTLRLKHLVCRGCPDLTDEGSIQVVTMCNDLELFDLSGCDQVGEDTVNAACTSVKMRNNNVHLRLIVGGTSFEPNDTSLEVQQLTVDLVDFSEVHLRPDIDDMFLPFSDSEDEIFDDEHFCCDCEFDFDDLYDSTVIPGDFFDDTPKFWDSDDSDPNEWPLKNDWSLLDSVIHCKDKEGSNDFDE